MKWNETGEKGEGWGVLSVENGRKEFMVGNEDERRRREGGRMGY